MSQCFVNGCRKPIIGGFEERITAPDKQNPYDTLPGLKTGWCSAHEAAGHQRMIGKSGRFLNDQDLK